MKIYLYLSTTIISVSLATSGNAWAQCVSTQDCATLGYTETSCPNGGVKCPFGSKWFCASSEITPKQCTELGFTLSCTDTNQTSGGGKACNGKYNYCSCADGYEWQNGACKQSTPDYLGCVVGALFYSDNTCSDKLESSKTLLGVVIYEKTYNQMGWIMTISPIQTGISWASESEDIPELTNITSKSKLTDIQASCTNTDIITAYGTSSKYKAAWAAKNYKPTGTPSGKSWCLPSGGLLNNLSNSLNVTKVNAGITTAGGTILGKTWFRDEGRYYEQIWSSSEYSSTNAWVLTNQTNTPLEMSNTSKGYVYGLYNKSVRPVLAF